MGRKTIELIDRRQISVDMFSKFLEVLGKRINCNDQSYAFDKLHDVFLSVNSLFSKLTIFFYFIYFFHSRLPSYWQNLWNN